MALVNQLLLTDRTKDDSSNPHLLDANVNDCFADDDYIYIATDGGLSILNRSSLSRAGYHQLDKKVTSVWASASYVYYATWGGGLYRVAKADINGDFSASATQFLHTGSTPSLPTDYLYKVRGHSDSAILIGHSKGVSFYNGSSVYSGYHLLADDFVDNNVGDDPAGWTIDETEGVVEVITDPFDSDEKCVRLYDDTGQVEFYKDFTQKTKVAVTYVVSVSGTGIAYLGIREGGSTRVNVRFNSDGSFEYSNQGTYEDIGLDYEPWRKYRISIVADASTNKFDLWVDGIKYLTDANFQSNAVSGLDRMRFASSSAGLNLYVHSVYITDATSDTFWGGPSKAVAITSSEIYYSTGSGVARKDSYPTADWEGVVDFHYDEDSTPELITDLPGKFEVTDLAVAEDKSSQDNTANRLVVGQRNGVTVIDEHSTPSSGVSTHYGRSDLTTNRQDKLAGYSDVVGAVAVGSDGSHLYVGTREDEDPSDNFEGTEIDGLRWEKVEENGGTVSQNGKLTLSTTSDDNSSGTLKSENRWIIVGDFDIQVDFENLTYGTPTSYVVFARLDVFSWPPEQNWGAFIERRADATTDNYGFAYFTDVWDSVNGGGADSSGKFRLVRKGGQITGYYWSNGWVQLGSYDKELTGPVFVRLLTHALTSGSAPSADYKNFKINKGTVIWLNGKPKGAYTKIKLADNSVQEFIEGLDAKALCM